MGVASFDAGYFTEQLTRKLGPEKWLTESQIRPAGEDPLQAGTASVIEALRKAFEAQSMAEHEETLEVFEENSIWDAPPLLLGFVQSKSALRMGLYMSKALGSWELRPLNAKVRERS